MLSFNAFLTESMSESDLPGVSKTLHDFLFHLSGPSDPAGKSKRSMSESFDPYLDEATLFDINRGDKPGKLVGKDGSSTPTSNKTSVAPAHVVHKAMNMPKTKALIDKAKEEGIGVGENLHKKIHEGFRKTFSSIGSENPAESRTKLKESRKVFEDFAKSRGYKKAPKLLNENGKTKKSTGEGVHTMGFALAPHSTSGLHGFDVCPRASHDCRANCLGTEAGGNRQYPDSALASKVFKTHFLAKHPEHAARIIDDEVGKHVKSATKEGYKPGVRLNVTSDFAWEHHAPELFKRHSEAQFYDYTKMHNRVDHPNLPTNYHLALSHTGSDHPESNDKHAAAALHKGGVVAMVYKRAKGTPKPTHVEDVKTGKRYPVMGGDEDDNTFDRHAQAGLTQGKTGHGVVSALKLKGVSDEAAKKFANNVDKDGVIRINK